ncbi:MAG TPA: DUF4175 family protein [Gemmatimonadales bacterium]|nr:DUF4175 family protein [Gemmatimonadales bacterium]
MTAPFTPRREDAELREAVRGLRARWRRRILAEGAAKVAVAALLALLAGVIVTKVVGAGAGSVVTVRVIGYLLIAAAAVRYLIGPFLGRLDDARFALYVEERAPELRQVLVSAVHELATPEPARPSPALSGRLMAQALSDVRRLDAGPGLEGSRFRRAAGILAGAAALAALLIAVGPPVLRDVARVLFIPWSEAAAAPVFAVQVEPGNATVPRGGALEIRATLRGFEAEGAELVLRADTASEWIRLPMLRDSAAAEFTARLFDLTSATEYYAESNEIRSRVYKLTIADLPAVSKFSLELRFPGYTGLPVERIEEGGDVAAVRGTTVTVRATTSRRVQGGSIRLDDGTTVPMTADSAGILTGAFRVARDGFYRLDLVATDGTAVPGAIQYVVEALEDQPPGVRIEEPGRDTKVTSVDEVTIAMRATDDYGVGSLELRYAVNGGAEKRIALSDSTPRRTRLDARAAHTLFLEELGLKPGDLVSYFATAKDGGGNTASSDIYFLEIRPFGRDYKQAESGGGGGGGGGESPEGLSARQRDLVAGTFNWLRDSARVSDRERRENVTTLAIGQGRLKTDVEALVRRLVERNIVSADTNFRLIHTALDSAAKEMQAAEDRLGRGHPREALPREQRALQLAQRAEAAYREVQVQMGGQQGGGGGGGASQAEDLADLFELENDKLRNQYESVQQEQEQAAQRELDETAERLKRLASRQQQENERMQRMADAMRDRLGQQGGGGGGGGSSQRELAREAEEEARRLERLAREKNSPELADAARRMQDAAEAMRRAASGSPNAQGQGGTALERLRSAAQKLENARAGSAAQDVKELQRRAEELGQRQREIAEGVNELPGAAGTERGERMRRLSERKDGLSSEVSRLEADAERLARETRRDQPGSANKLSEAAGAIRDTRLRDKIAYSKALMGSSSSEAIRNLEGLIGENLDEVAEKIRSAAGALSENSGLERDRALEKARDLVKGLESLRDRIQERGSQGAREPGSQGQQQGQQATGSRQQGEQGQQGQGQQGQGQGQGQGQQGQGGRQGQGDPSQPGQGSQLGMPGGGQTGGGGQPGRLNGGDARQFSREFGLRRQAAEGLRRELAGQEMDQAELDRIIADLRRLESGRPFSDPQGLEELQRAVIEGLKTWEFKLWRSLSQNGENRPALGAPSQVPAEYRALVEEYYRSLGKKPR